MTAGDAIGTYRLVSLLGMGGMGEVWLAEHDLLGHRVALKVLRTEVSERADVVERFFDEARAAARVVDPGIVRVHDFGRHHGTAYLVMEYLAGETLARRLARVRTLSPRVASRLLHQVASTMAVAHDRGIVHRDLKPDNLLVAADAAVDGGERVKVLDFGIAKLHFEHGTSLRTQTGAVLGTPAYMSPEQCRSAARADHRSDIYALGCVLFEMLCGCAPFVGDTPGDLIAAHLIDPVPVASSVARGLPAALDDVIARCLAKSPDDRFPSMAALAHALAPIAGVTETAPAIPVDEAPSIALLTTLGTGVGEAHPGRPPTRIRPRHAVAVIAGTLAVLAALVFGLARGTAEDKLVTPASSITTVVPVGTRPPERATAQLLSEPAHVRVTVPSAAAEDPAAPPRPRLAAPPPSVTRPPPPVASPPAPDELYDDRGR